MMQDIMELGKWTQEGQKQSQIWHLSDRIGKGFMKQTEIRPGMTLTRHNRYFFNHKKAKIECHDPAFSFYYCLSGIERLKISGCGQDTVIRQGQSGITMKGKGLKGTTETPSREQYNVISVELPRSFLSGGTDEHDGGFLKIFNRICAGEGPGFYNRSMPASPQTRVVAEQLMNTTFSGPARQIYLEGKVLEFIAHMMMALDDKGPGPGPHVRLRSGDMERIYSARDLLRKDLAHPPSLFELARTVGMNHFKLNRGFKEVFGNTVFGHLRELRLEKAKQLLMKGNMNVTEVSLCVGYSCLSHFAKVFKAQYGASPGAFLGRIYPAGSITRH